ncbi:MAG: hypothetical protein ACOX2W_07710 [Desulfomonilia bacterium]
MFVEYRRRCTMKVIRHTDGIPLIGQSGAPRGCIDRDFPLGALKECIMTGADRGTGIVRNHRDGNDLVVWSGLRAMKNPAACAWAREFVCVYRTGISVSPTVKSAHDKKRA